MKYKILNDYDIRCYKPIGKHSCLIRVLEPEYKKVGIPYRLKSESDFSSVTELYFHDIRENLPQKERFILFNEDMANNVIELISQNQFDEVVVHCNAGQSRSAGIMLGIAMILKNKTLEEEILLDSYYMPNPIVVNSFRKALDM
ncbi:hypothetical protein SIM22_05425 [Bacillus cereus group sp. BfR-BA-01363]|uniref:hypothetical protein n=1 Tax=Bacillus cereus group sp. BfR-BA-01363 TaxID=3094882 RepID=UPI0029C24EA2|nr:hypothetical protein [Bacillus cereus group sp. BfR-BA-01363]MDX5853574.1 hypothetical protein [Bacillus cereus group sp. BfR-BA-01363]